MKTRFLLLAFVMALFSACAPSGHTPYYAIPGVNNVEQEYDQLTLRRTACYGFCPVYELTVYEQDILIFKGERFVAEMGGATSKRLPDGSFKKLINIANIYEFSALDARYPNAAGDNCGPVATDMPSIFLSIAAKRLDHKTEVYQGCLQFDGREKFDAMIAEMDAVFDIADFIGPREDFTGQSE